MKREVMRQCVACREKKAKDTMLRIVKPKEGDCQIDPSGHAPGRGAYICCNAQCVHNAKKKRKLERALRTHIKEDFYEEILDYVTETR